MKYIKQLAVILSVSFAGELIHYFVPLPIPASIYGLLLMFALLACRVIKVEDVKETAGFLVGVMPLMFIPAAVGLVNSFDMIRPRILQYAAITVVVLAVVMTVSGRVAQAVIRHGRKKQ